MMGPVMRKGAEERYYNRGQSEEALEAEARALVQRDWGRQPLPGQPLEAVGGLTPYEMCRAPLPPDPQAAVEADLKQVRQDLSCPVCLGLLRDTHTTIQCMHRFCHECIVHSLRLGNKECPTCREKLPSKRNLRPDPAFDRLVAAIFPDPEELEQQEQRDAAAIGASLDVASIGRAVAEGLARQARAPPPPPHEQRAEASPQPAPHRPKRPRLPDDPRRKTAAAAVAVPPPLLVPPAAPVQRAARLEVQLTRNPNESRLGDLALPAVVLPALAPLSVLADIVARCAAAAPLVGGVVFSVLPPGGDHPVLVDPTLTAADVQERFFGGPPNRLALQYQSQVLAHSMAVAK